MSRPGSRPGSRAGSRAGGRRAITRTSTRRAGVLGLVVVGLTLGMLTLSGTTPLGIGRPVDKPSVVSLSTRTFSCTGGIAGTTTVSGDVENGVSAPRAVTTTPATITVDRDLARDAFAG
ncbi:MAG TPA: hypothetical protein VFE15_01140, partial [Marmoricola sp.]|nr:hypothetical protein [Marmoricola sp.]